MKVESNSNKPFRILWVVVAVLGLAFNAGCLSAAPYPIGVLMLSDIRLDPLNGMKAGLQTLGLEEGKDVVYAVKNAGGQRSRLPEMAREIVAGRPGVAVACGGVEADALKEATQGSDVPVVFLAVASAIDRGLIASMTHPGGNLTGIDTNDTPLTAKRLWLIRKMLPRAERLLIPSIPTITPSVKTVAVARSRGPELGFAVQVLEAADKDGMRQAAADYDFSNIDVIYIGMAAPVWQIEKEVFWPLSRAKGIPIMGINRGDLKRGAVAAYACYRYDAGKQAARLVQKIIEGASPAALPAETPETIEFVINKWTVDRLNLNVSRRVWRLADDVVQHEVTP